MIGQIEENGGIKKRKGNNMFVITKQTTFVVGGKENQQTMYFAGLDGFISSHWVNDKINAETFDTKEEAEETVKELLKRHPAFGNEYDIRGKINMNMNGLYAHKVEPSWLSEWNRNDPYHCHNWTFRPLIRRDGILCMADTYFGDFCIEVTEENKDEWELIFDFTEVQEIKPSRYCFYEKQDVYCVAVDSGGIKYPRYYVSKGAKESAQKTIEKLEYDIADWKRRIELAESEIERLRKTQ